MSPHSSAPYTPSVGFPFFCRPATPFLCNLNKSFYLDPTLTPTQATQFPFLTVCARAVLPQWLTNTCNWALRTNYQVKILSYQLAFSQPTPPPLPLYVPHVCAWACVHGCMCMGICAWARVHVCAWVSVHGYLCVGMCAWACVHGCVCMDVCVHVPVSHHHYSSSPFSHPPQITCHSAKFSSSFTQENRKYLHQTCLATSPIVVKIL